MRYVAAYLLASLSGNASPDVAAIEKILSSVGIECKKDLATKVISELKGKNLEDLVKEGSSKLSSMPAAAPAAAAAAPAAAAKKEEPSMLFFCFCFVLLLLDANMLILDICCSLSVCLELVYE
jgi:large subunit ribosomal protein LP2